MKKECEKIIKFLSDYIDKEIDEAMAFIIEKHLERCKRCLSLLHTIEKTISLTKEFYGEIEYPSEKVIEKVYYEVRIRYTK